MGSTGEEHPAASKIATHHCSSQDTCPELLPLAELVATSYKSLLAQAKRTLRSDTDAEEAVQEALLRATRALPKIDCELKIEPWVRRILANVCVDFHVRRVRQARLQQAVEGYRTIEVPEPSEQLSDPATWKMLHGAVGNLPESQRSALWLRAVDDLSYAEIADRMAVSEENARARVHRARQTLRRQVQSIAAFALLPARELAGWSRLRRAGWHTSLRGIRGGGLVGTAQSAQGAQEVSSLSSSFGQGVAQVTASPIGQVATQMIASGSGSGRSSIAVGVVAGILTATGAAGHMAASSSHHGANSSKPSLVSTTSEPPAAPQDNPSVEGGSSASSGAPASPTSNEVTAKPSQPPATTTSPAPSSDSGSSSASDSSKGTLPYDAWIAAASEAAGTTGQAGTDGSDTQTGQTQPSSTSTSSTGSKTTSQSPSTTTSQSTASKSPSPAPSKPVATVENCPWLSSFAGATPASVATPAPTSASPIATGSTSSMALSSTGPALNASSAIELTPTTGGPAGEMHVLFGACLPGASQQVLVVNLTGTGPTGAFELQLRGALVMTTGTSSDAGYLFRGDIVELSGQAPLQSIFPGADGHFVADIAVTEPANKATLTLALLGDTQSGSSSGSSGASDSSSGTTTGSGAQTSTTQTSSQQYVSRPTGSGGQTTLVLQSPSAGA